MTELISHFQKDNKPSTIFILMKTQNSFQPSMQNMEQSNCGSVKIKPLLMISQPIVISKFYRAFIHIFHVKFY